MASWCRSEKNKEARSYSLELSKGKEEQQALSFLALSYFIGLLIQLVLV